MKTAKELNSELDRIDDLLGLKRKEAIRALLTEVGLSKYFTSWPRARDQIHHKIKQRYCEEKGIAPGHEVYSTYHHGNKVVKSISKSGSVALVGEKGYFDPFNLDSPKSK